MSAGRFLLSPINSAERKSDKNDELNLKEEALVWNEFLKGSDIALASIYRNYVGKLYNYGRQILNDDEIVCDCIQDLFYELIRTRQKLSKTTSVKNYLYASLRRRLIRHRKGESKIVRENLTEGHFKLSFLKDKHKSFEHCSEEQIELLERACNTLSERQREAIVLYFFEELSYAEIAEVMNIGKIRSARALVYRAIDSLRNILDAIKDDLIILSTLFLDILVQLV